MAASSNDVLIRDMDVLPKKIEKTFTGVELHVHLDGSLTADLLVKLFKKHNVSIDLSKEELHSKITVPGRTTSLTEVLDPFFYFTPLIAGNLGVLEDIAHAFVQRQFDSNVFYTEVRYSPHVLQGDKSCEDVVSAVCRGLKRGQEEYGVVVRSLLCVMRHLPPKQGFEIVNLVKKYQSQGVVGIDLAGDEIKFPNELFFEVFDKANEAGLNITIHAGEAAGPESVTSAVTKMHAQRIGHGYHCIDNEDCYNMVREKQICLETCPTSSWRTAGVPQDWGMHPLHQFNRDHVNWVLCTDDPGLFDIDYSYELKFSRETFHFDDDDIAKSLLRGMEASFLPEQEKAKMISTLQQRLGLKSN